MSYRSYPAVRELERMVEARDKDGPFGFTANRLHAVEQKAAHAVTLLHEWSEDFSEKLKELAGSTVANLGVKGPMKL